MGLYYIAKGILFSKSYRGGSTVGVGWGAKTYLVVSSTPSPPLPLDKSSITLKHLLDHTLSAFRIAIRGTSTGFLETI
jgi:hypothetical protein